MYFYNNLIILSVRSYISQIRSRYFLQSIVLHVHTLHILLIVACCKVIDQSEWFSLIKVKLSMYLSKHHAMKTYDGMKGHIALRILNLGTTRRWVVTLSWLLCLGAEFPVLTRQEGRRALVLVWKWWQIPFPAKLVVKYSPWENKFCIWRKH
jgi:hypothetical protein